MSDKKILHGNFGRDELEREQSTSGGKVDNLVGNRVPKVDCTQTIKYDENGNVLVDTVRKNRSMNGSGFVISYTEKICELLAKIPTGSVIRVFFYIAHNQQYGSDGKTFGYRCSKKHLCEVLRMDRTVVWEALKTLRENYLVLESNIEGQSEFMVNPNYITIGNSKKERLREWSRRWEEHFKRTGGKL